MKIINVYTQKVPATRFIGKKYGDEDRVNGFFGQKWGDAFEHGLFGIIEKNAGTETFFTDSNSCIGLMRVKDGEPFEYWIGKFTPESTEVPNELQYIDFPESEIGIGWIYGSDKTGEIYGHECDVAKELDKAGHPIKHDSTGACWFFERYQCSRFTPQDSDGNVILDIGFFISK